MSDDVDLLRDEVADAIDDTLMESLDDDDYNVEFKAGRPRRGVRWIFTIHLYDGAIEALQVPEDDDE